MMRRRSPFGLFLMVGFGVLFGAALFGGIGAVGSVVAAPFLVLGFMFKIVLFFVLFGLVAKMFAGSARRDQAKPGTGPDHPHNGGLKRPGRPGLEGIQSSEKPKDESARMIASKSGTGWPTPARKSTTIRRRSKAERPHCES